MISVVADYLVHDSGSKFYETVLAWIDDGATTGRAILVKRWGPIAKNAGGGQVKIERFDNYSEAWREMTSIVTEKRKYRSGKGAYKEMIANFGLHRRTSGTVNPTALASDELCDELTKHYDGVHVRGEILNYFDIDEHGDIDLPMDVFDVVEEGIEEEPVIVRDQSWGSW